MSFGTWFNQTNRRLNAALNRAMPLITPVAVAVGLVAAPVFKPGKPLVMGLFGFVTLTSALGLDLSDFAQALKKPVRIGVVLFVSHIVIPLVSLAGARLVFPGNANLTTGYILLAAIPTAVASSIWTGIYAGNHALTLTILLIDTLLSPVVTPWTVQTLAHSSVTIDVTGMVASLFGMVVIPSVIGTGANQLSKGRLKQTLAPVFQPLSKPALALVIMINTAQIADQVSFDRRLIPVGVLSALLAFGGYLLGFGAAQLIGADTASTVSMTYTSAMRNISASMVLAIQFFPPETVTPIIAGIMLQQVLCALTGVVLFRKQSAGKG